MNEFFEKAKEKLSDLKSVSGQKENAMKAEVSDALMSFCEQEPEFAQAVVQGGSFADCMKSVAKGTGSSISDIEAYRKAVEFYFPGAKVNFKMTIDLIGDAAAPQEDKPEVKKSLSFNLDDFI